MKNKQSQKRPVDSGNKLVKAYNMVVSGETSAEINMYGNVVATVPRDWKTGERIAGYIGLDEYYRTYQFRRRRSLRRPGNL